MELFEFTKFLGRNKKILIFSILFFMLVTAGLTLIQPLDYSAKSRLLIVQDSSSVLDPYSASKANEYLSNVLTNVVVSTSFYGEVINSGFNIDTSYFTKTSGQLAQKWHDTVEAKSVGDLGLIEITVYHSDKYQLDQLAQAINYTLKAKNNQYHNAGDQVSIKVIDEPVISSLPVRPNLLLNFGLALFLGLVFGFLWVYLIAINKLSSIDFNFDFKNPMKPEFLKSNSTSPIKPEPVLPLEEQAPAVKPAATLAEEAKPATVSANQPSSAPEPGSQTVKETEAEEIFDGDIKNLYGVF